MEAYNEVFNNPQHAIVADDAGCMMLLLEHVTQLSDIHQQFISTSKLVSDNIDLAAAFHDMVSTYASYFNINNLKVRLIHLHQKF